MTRTRLMLALAGTLADCDDTTAATCETMPCDDGGDAADLAPACTPYASADCASGDVYWYDSCGTREALKQSCGGNGCTGTTCDAPPCTTHASFHCDSGDVYWFDSCGARETIAQSCAGLGCTGATCNGPACTSHASFHCDSGDLYWFDSCGAREGVKQSCAGLGCTGAACNMVTCTSHASEKCDGGDVYWFDSCGARETVAQSCGGNGCAQATCLLACAPSCAQTREGQIIAACDQIAGLTSDGKLTASTPPRSPRIRSRSSTPARPCSPARTSPASSTA
jgi:hypothetical protein